MLLRFLTLVFCMLAVPAHADWTESGETNISVATSGEPAVIAASDIEPDDEIVGVSIGTAGASAEDGIVTVSQQSGVDRYGIGHWTINNGTGNVQATYGAAGGFNVGSGTSETSLDGLLDILSSDITGGRINVRHGTLRVRAASKVAQVEVFPFGTAYISEFSTIATLKTHAGSFTYIDDSFVDSGTLACGWRGTVRANDSRVECGVLNVALEGVAEIGLLSLGTSVLEVTNQLAVTSADLSVQSTDVTTGSLAVNGSPSTVDMNGGTWTNVGALDVVPGNPDPDVLRIRGGAEFHQQGLARVAGIDSADEHLVVTGNGTLLELDQDLHLGEYFTLGNPQSYPGTLTIADGATIIVHGTFQIGAQAVVNLEAGGTIHAAALDDQGGTINQNGGELIVPEPSAAASALAAIGVVAALARRGRLRR